MHFLLAGVSHTSAPLERLQRLAINRHALAGILEQATLHLGDVVILSTCNRTEIYATADEVETGTERLLEFLELIDKAAEPDAEPLTPHVYTMADDEVIRQLFRVTAGLDALVLGEPEIVGQVTFSLRTAGEAGTVSPRLSRLFHHALRTSRKVRRETAIGRSRVSVSSIGVDLLRRSAESFDGLRVLVVGAGETGLQAARALKRNGVNELLVASRRTERASVLAAELGGRHLPMDEVGEALADVDAVVTCTSAETTVVSGDQVEKAMVGRADRPMFILDVAMPLDVDRAAARVPGVSLYGLEHLTGIADEHRAERQAAADEAEGIIEREVEHFKELLTGARSEPLIRALGQRAEAVRDEELKRALGRIGNLDETDADVIDAMTRAIVKKILADPISYLRELDDLESAEAVAKAFDIDAELPDETEDVDG